jgi:hypothetical protein
MSVQQCTAVRVLTCLSHINSLRCVFCVCSQQQDVCVYVGSWQLLAATVAPSNLEFSSVMLPMCVPWTDVLYLARAGRV